MIGADLVSCLRTGASTFLNFGAGAIILRLGVSAAYTDEIPSINIRNVDLFMLFP
jgi:hypothetical protein